MASVLGEEDAGAIAKATLFGAASSGCSFGAVTIGKGLFEKSAHAVNVLTFMFVYADLITVPVLNVYRKYYGWPVMGYIFGVFFVRWRSPGS